MRCRRRFFATIRSADVPASLSDMPSSASTRSNEGWFIVRDLPLGTVAISKDRGPFRDHPSQPSQYYGQGCLRSYRRAPRAGAGASDTLLVIQFLAFCKLFPECVYLVRVLVTTLWWRNIPIPTAMRFDHTLQQVHLSTQSGA